METMKRAQFETWDAFGFHTARMFQHKFDGQVEEQVDEGIKSLAKLANATKIISYIPIIGTIAAIGKLIFAFMLYHGYKKAQTTTQDDTSVSEGTKKVFKAAVIRSCFEVFSLGIFFLLPDLIITLGRFHSSKS